MKIHKAALGCISQHSLSVYVCVCFLFVAPLALSVIAYSYAILTIYCLPSAPLFHAPVGGR